MSAKTGSAQSRYAGLLPIEPRPIDLKPKLIDLKPEPIDLVPFSNGQWSARKRPRLLARMQIAFCMVVTAALLWQSYGDAAREIVANFYLQLGRPAPQPALIAANPRPSHVIVAAASSGDSDVVGQNADKRATAIGADREPTTRDADQIATGREPTTRSTDQIAASKPSGITVESRANAAWSQPTARLDTKPTEARPPQTLTEKEKPLSSCFASATAVVQNHPGGWPTWTLRAPGHEGTMCWYAAARPRGNDHRIERTARKQMVGTMENGLSAPPAKRPQWWDRGLP